MRRFDKEHYILHISTDHNEDDHTDDDADDSDTW